MSEKTGVYIHIPFCAKKCLYCDFYSAIYSKEVYSKYLHALFREIRSWGRKISRPVDTVYIGGGTPSLLGDDIIPLLDVIRESFALTGDAEITAECNPNAKPSFYGAAKKSGVNRISFGVQAGDDDRLLLLGRTHTVGEAENAVAAARRAGFDNISCDIMIALPGSDIRTLKEDADFICSLSPEHISAYILKIEQNTAFHSIRDRLSLPDDDQTAEQYLTLCGELQKRGYEHYEVSNFARENKKSRHNLKYWQCGEYLGIGPAAHSFLCGKRFYYPRDLRAFIKGNEPVGDGEGGDRAERIMLGLRISEGVEASLLGEKSLKKAEDFKKVGLVRFSEGRISLTNRGMLLSNSVITELIYEDL